MMSSLAQHFKQGPAYVGYITVGDGGLKHSLESALALIDGGVNVLELGVPFSDPVADGPTIQQAAARALKNGTKLADVLTLASQIRIHSDIPLVLFSYYNPILNAGDDFYSRAKKMGIDACLIVDLPLEESLYYEQQSLAAGIDPIFIITPSTPKERIQKIADKAKGMLYYACRKGTTGVKDAMPKDFATKLAEIKSITDLPIVAGFGISNRSMAKQVLKHADGFVVGSYFVKAIAERKTQDEIMHMAQALDPR